MNVTTLRRLLCRDSPDNAYIDVYMAVTKCDTLNEYMDVLAGFADALGAYKSKVRYLAHTHSALNNSDP